MLGNRWSLVGLAILWAIWTIALFRLFVDHTPRIPLLFNWSGSLPYHVAWLERGATVARGDFVVYSFEGRAAKDYPGLTRQPFFKVIAGAPGDSISLDGRNVYVAGAFAGFAKLRTMDGRMLTPVSASHVPGGHYYVRGTGADSLDSRYSEGGFVPVGAVIGKVHPWF